MEFLLEDEFLSHWKTTATQQRCDQDDPRASRTHSSRVARGSSNLKKPHGGIAQHGALCATIRPRHSSPTNASFFVITLQAPSTTIIWPPFFHAHPLLPLFLTSHPCPTLRGPQSPIVQNTRVCHIIIFGQMFFWSSFWSGVPRQKKHTECNLLLDTGAKL